MILRLVQFVFSPFLLFSQSYSIDGNLVNYHLGAFQNDSLVVFSNDLVFSYPLDRPSESISRPIYNEIFTSNDVDSQNRMQNFIPISVDDQLYFIQQKGGLVFKFENDSIKRIDRSFMHRMQIGSNIFSRGSKIYRYGGYGFWSFRNFFTYFSPEILEWEAESPLNSKIFPEGSAHGLYAYNENSFVVFNGNIDNHNNLNDTSNLSDEIWSYNFEDMSWSHLGDLIIDLEGVKSKQTLGDEIILIVNDSKLKRIKPFENKVQHYQLTTLQHKLYTYQGNLSVFKKDGTYYSFVKFDNINKVELVKRNEDEFFGQLIDETKLYQDLSPWRYMLLLLALPMLYYIRKFALLSKERNSKIIINGEGLIYHKVFFEFEAKELEVINLLLDFDIVHSSDILALVENPNHNYSHNMRTKNQLIDKINYKFKTMLKIDYDLITSEKSAEDKRIIDYRIDKTYFN